MTRLLILNLLIGLGLGSVLLLPKAPPVQDSAIILNLPLFVGLDWWGGPDEDPAPEVKEILKAQAYRNRTYIDNYGSPLTDLSPSQTIQAGIVLSSDNVNQSIHRPERCLPAQGFQLIETQSVAIPIPDFEKSLPTTRLLAERKTKGSDGKVIRQRLLTYYWFVGKDTVTNSHYERSAQDLQDRLLKGYSQRWAYVTVDIAIDPNMSVKEIKDKDQTIQDFIADLAPSVISEEKIANW